MKKVTEKEDESLIYDQIKSIVMREIAAMVSPSRIFDYDQLKRLESLTKIYCALKDDLRCDVKAGLLGGP